MRILVVGDVHGNTDFMRTAIERAAARGITTILQVGDFGYWPHTKSGEKFLTDLERTAGIDLPSGFSLRPTEQAISDEQREL
jgi:hypothetical protein